MSVPAVFTWPAAVTTAICLGQQTLAAANLLINGTLARWSPNSFGSVSGGNPYVDFGKISRTVSLTVAVANLSGINFTITGTYRGGAQTETRVGPNNNTVYTTKLFDTVTSVSVDAAVGTNVSVGSGTTGQTKWFNNNPYAGYPSMAIQVVVSGANITYSFQTTLDDVNLTATPTVFTPIAAMTGATTSQLGSYAIPARYSNIIVSAATTDSLVATFLSQGIR